MNAGVTTILDWSHINTTPEHTDAVIQALQRVGDPRRLRVRPELLPPEPRDEPLSERHLPAPGAVLLVGGPAADARARRRRAAIRRRAVRRRRVEHGAPSGHPGADHARTSASAPTGPGFVKQLVGRPGRRRASRPRARHDVHPLVHAHGPGAGPRSQDTGGSFSVAGPIEMQMGHGMPPIQKALDRGIPISLSVDVETNQPTDMFTQMRVVLRAPARAQERGAPVPLPDPRPGARGASSEAADHARRAEARDDRRREGERARPQGRHAHAREGGRHRPAGRDADQRRAVQQRDGCGRPGMDTSNVDSVLIAGKFVKRNGKLVGVNVEQAPARGADRARRADGEKRTAALRDVRPRRGRTREPLTGPLGVRLDRAVECLLPRAYSTSRHSRSQEGVSRGL